MKLMLTLLGGGQIGTSWSIPPSHTMTTSLLYNPAYSSCFETKSAGILRSTRTFASFFCRRRTFEKRVIFGAYAELTFEKRVIFGAYAELRYIGHMYAMDAAWVRREVNLSGSPLTNTRIQFGGEILAA